MGVHVGIPSPLFASNTNPHNKRLPAASSVTPKPCYGHKTHLRDDNVGPPKVHPKGICENTGGQLITGHTHKGGGVRQGGLAGVGGVGGPGDLHTRRCQNNWVKPGTGSAEVQQEKELHSEPAGSGLVSHLELQGAAQRGQALKHQALVGQVKAGGVSIHGGLSQSGAVLWV